MGTTRERIRRHGWWAYAACAAAATLVYFTAPRVSGSGWLFNLVGLSAAGAIVAGVRLHRPQRRLPWYLFAAAQVLFVAGDFLYYTLPEIVHSYTPDFPSVGDIPYISVYPFIIAGLLLVIHARNPRRDRAALVDALIVGVGVGVVSWVYLMVPYAQDQHLPLGTKALSIAYPLMDVLVLAVTVRLAVDAGRRAAGFHMLLFGLAGLVVTDSIYGLIELNGTYKTGSLLDIGWIVYYVAWGVAALHPSMRTLTQPVPDTRRTLGRRRLALLAAATLLSPVVELTRMGKDRFALEGMLVMASIVLFLLVVARLRIAVVQHDEAERRERALREAGAALVSSSGRAEARDAAITATRRLVGTAAHVYVCDSPSETRWPELPEEVNSELREGRSVSLAAVPPAVAEAAGVPQAGCLLVTPLATRDRLAGLIAIITPRRLERPMRESVEALASQVALALDAAELAEEAHQRRSEARFRSLVQNSSDIVTVVDADATIRYQSPAIEHVLGHDPPELVGTSLLDLVHPDDRVRVRGMLVDIGRRPATRPDVLEARWRSSSGDWTYVEMLWTDLTDDPNVGGVVLNTRDIGERKAIEAQLAHQAFHDPVTDLANRALFHDRVQHALDLQEHGGTALAVVFLDLDDFKTVNDSLGHAAGDELLGGVAERLRASVRRGDTAARLGGDEFALLLEHADRDTAVAVAATLIDALGAPFRVEGREVFIRASVGITIREPATPGGRTADDLLREADAAMYMAKELGKGGFQLYEPRMRQVAVRRLELTSELRRALEKGELRLHYQPIVELWTGRILKVEALLRWRHPVLGLTSPAEFVPLAEETGLIVPIGRWAIEEACREAARLQGAGPGLATLGMAVNLSARQLQHPGLLDDVALALMSAHVDPATLTLEITESMVVGDSGAAAEGLRELKRIGVQIAVDDFGIEYSSLNYLRQFPLDVLKVDRSFVERLDRSPEDRAIAHAIIRLAGELGLGAVAEGIETAEQLRLLLELECAHGQGYYLAPPMEAGALAALLVDQKGLVRRPAAALVNAPAR